jgi:cation:H+ antiporter
METALQLIGGLVLLAVGGEFVVRGAVAIARKLGVSELLIGLTLIGFGTSTPELLTSLNAAFAGSPGIALGNVVGSNVSNILLVFALIAIVRPVAVDPRAISRDGFFMISATLAFIAIAVFAGEFNRVSGGVLVALLVSYMVFAFLQERRGGAAAELHEAEAQQVEEGKTSMLMAVVMAVGGIAALIFGADLLVAGAITLAQMAGLSETVIGLTIVAVGTSLPELVASLAAALKGRSEVAFGNIVGSNIYNILGIIGITALVRPLEVPADLVARDWVAMYGAAVLLVMHAATGAKVQRWEGGALLAHYVFYVLVVMGVVGAVAA